MLPAVKEYLYTNFHKMRKNRKNGFLPSREPTWLSRSMQQCAENIGCLEVYCSVRKTLAKRCTDGKSPWQADTKISTLCFSRNSFQLSVLSIKQFSQSICSPEAMNMWYSDGFQPILWKGIWKIAIRFRRNLL